MTDWTIVAKGSLPPLDRIIELAVVSDYDGSLYRAFGCRSDPGEGWVWSLAGYGIPDNCNDCDDADDCRVFAWREPTPLPPPPPAGWNGAPVAVDPPRTGQPDPFS